MAGHLSCRGALVLVLVDTSAVDFAVEGWFYTAGDGFIGKHVWVLEDFMHDFLKKAVIAVALLALLGWMASFSRRQWRQWRLPLGYLIMAMGLSAGIVTPLKDLTGVQCPWDIVATGLIAWLICLGCYRALLYRRGSEPA